MLLDNLAQAAQNYDPAAHIPSPPPMATLSISPNGYMRLHTSIRWALGLQHGQPINLVPPVFNDIHWHLDLRKTAPRRVVWYKDTGMRAEGIILPPGLVTETITLHLLRAPLEHANYHPLVQLNALPA
jgi:hypothetical protein